MNSLKQFMLGMFESGIGLRFFLVLIAFILCYFSVFYLFRIIRFSIAFYRFCRVSARHDMRKVLNQREKEAHKQKLQEEEDSKDFRERNEYKERQASLSTKLASLNEKHLDLEQNERLRYVDEDRVNKKEEGIIVDIAMPKKGFAKMAMEHKKEIFQQMVGKSANDNRFFQNLLEAQNKSTDRQRGQSR